jgi:DNA replicative helicase MCM subunit Mcm2 (Cdc46/Mcm family)
VLAFRNVSVKQYIDIRMKNVPPIKEVKLDSIRNLREYHVSKYITIFGTVVRTTSVKNRELQKDYECRK